MEQLKGKRVRVVLELPTLVEAMVVDESENGVVLDWDPSTAVIVNDNDRDRSTVEHFLRRQAPQAERPVWLGRAHVDGRLEVLPQTMVSMLDEDGITRAYGVANTQEAARTEAHRQLQAYIEEKNALGYTFTFTHFREQVSPVEEAS